MQIPNIPTDNLYKFISVFGLVLFIFSMFMAISLYNDNFNKRIALAINDDLTTADSIRMRDSIVYFEKIIIIEKNNLQNKYNLFCDTIDLTTIKLNDKQQEQIKNILKLNLKLNTLKSRIKYRKYELSIKNRVLDINKNIYYGIIVILVLLFALGVSLSCFGFYKWYIKTQKYYDKKLKKDVLIEFDYVKKSEALKYSYNIFYKIFPVKSYKNQDWDDVLSIIISKFSQIQNELMSFRNKYSSFLTNDINKLVNKSINNCSSAQSFSQSIQRNLADEVYDNQLEIIDKITKLLKKEI